MLRLGALLVPAVLIGVACVTSTDPLEPAPGHAPAVDGSPVAKAASAESDRPTPPLDRDAGNPTSLAPSSASGATPEAEARSEATPAELVDGDAADPISAIFRELNPTGPKQASVSRFSQLLPRDAIEPVYSPEYRTARQVALDPEDLVIGVSIAGEHRAYPIKTLASSEMVNDVLGRAPILVTW